MNTSKHCLAEKNFVPLENNRQKQHSCGTKRYKCFLQKKQNLDSFTLKGSGDQNFKFDENGRKSLKLVENTMEKGEIARYVPFSFSTVFSKDLYSRHI